MEKKPSSAVIDEKDKLPPQKMSARAKRLMIRREALNDRPEVDPARQKYILDHAGRFPK